MAADLCFRDLHAPQFSQPLLEQNNVTFKLIKTVCDFTQQLSSIHEQHAEELQILIETFRKRNGELRKERPPCSSSLFNTWEVLLQEIEVDSQVHSDIARSLGRQVGMMMLEKTFHRKIQSRKIFLHRESMETILSKAEELLNKCHDEYSEAYRRLAADGSRANLTEYYNKHNAYVQQLHATNGMLEYYQQNILPGLLEELEGIYVDVSNTVAASIDSAATVLSAKAKEQAKHYESILAAAKSINTKADLVNYIRTLTTEKSEPPILRHQFSAPFINAGSTIDPVYKLGDELIVDTSIANPHSRFQSLRQDVSALESQIKQLQEAVDSLRRLQQRSLENSLYNKANELQEDISMKVFDLQVANIHLRAVKSQLDLLKKSTGDNPDVVIDRKSATVATGGMKNRWLKAFSSLKKGTTNAEKSEGDKKNNKGNRPLSIQSNPESNQHVFQEYTYKKITGCDVCREILKGHTRQGLKCKLCRINVHAGCQDKVGTCQASSSAT